MASRLRGCLLPKLDQLVCDDPSFRQEKNRGNSSSLLLLVRWRYSRANYFLDHIWLCCQSRSNYSSDSLGLVDVVNVFGCPYLSRSFVYSLLFWSIRDSFQGFGS